MPGTSTLAGCQASKETTKVTKPGLPDFSPAVWLIAYGRSWGDTAPEGMPNSSLSCRKKYRNSRNPVYTLSFPTWVSCIFYEYNPIRRAVNIPLIII